MNHSKLHDVVNDLHGCRYDLHISQLDLEQVNIPFSLGGTMVDVKAALESCRRRLGGCFSTPSRSVNPGTQLEVDGRWHCEEADWTI